MRGTDDHQDGLFSYVSLDARVPSTHPLRAVREMVDRALAGMSREFEAIYAVEGRPSIAPERLLHHRLEDLVPELRDKRGAFDDDPNLENKILAYLTYLEALVSEIGLMCIRQIIVGVYSDIVRKVFSVLAGLVAILLLAYVNVSGAIKLLIYGAPVFFGIFILLLFLELARHVHQEAQELLDFVESEERSDDSSTVESNV